MDASFGSLLVPAALLLGAPAQNATVEKGLFCETVALVRTVAARAEQGQDPRATVAVINAELDRRACIYQSEVRSQTIRFETHIVANRSVFAIYQVNVTAIGRYQTEVGNIYWALPAPVPMYTLRAAMPDDPHGPAAGHVEKP